MRQSDSNRRPEEGPPLPDFAELDPDEASEYGAFRDEGVELDDVLEGGDDPAGPDNGGGRGV